MATFRQRSNSATAGFWEEEVVEFFVTPAALDRYFQHNPLVASGRDAVVKFLLIAPVVAVLADGDLVTVVLAREYRDPKDSSKTAIPFERVREFFVEVITGPLRRRSVHPATH